MKKLKCKVVDGKLEFNIPSEMTPDETLYKLSIMYNKYMKGTELKVSASPHDTNSIVLYRSEFKSIYELSLYLLSFTSLRIFTYRYLNGELSYDKYCIKVNAYLYFYTSFEYTLDELIPILIENTKRCAKGHIAPTFEQSSKIKSNDNSIIKTKLYVNSITYNDKCYVHNEPFVYNDEIVRIKEFYNVINVNSNESYIMLYCTNSTNATEIEIKI